MYEPGIVVREVGTEDLEKVAPLVIRFYRFNEEFDPAWSTKDLSLDYVKSILKDRLSSGDILYLAEIEGKVIGFLRAEISINPFLENDKVVAIKELYVMPGYRRRGTARRLIEEVNKVLERINAKILAAEFPSLNTIADNFYKKQGFRKYLSTYIREV